MKSTIKKWSIFINIAVIISLFLNTFFPSLAYAYSTADDHKTYSSNQALEASNNTQISSINPNSVILSSISQVGNNLSIQKSYTEITCIEGTDIHIVSGDACTLPAGTHSFSSIQIDSGGAIIATSNFSTGEGVKIVTGSLLVSSGGLITGDGKGYASSSGPGKGENGTGAYKEAAGAGHGGKGGNGTSLAAGGMAYGDVYMPTSLGSGGGSIYATPGGAGGGAIEINVSGSLVNNGIISVNGTNGFSNTFDGTGGGSGGSLIITASSLSGSGEFQANGGNSGASAYYGSGGGGAGGRLAFNISASNNLFTGSYKAFGGTGNQIGGAGTIYFAVEDKLLINNNTQIGSITPLPSAVYDFNTLELKGKATLRVQGTDSSISFSNSTLTGDNTARLDIEGTVNAPADFIVSNVTLAILNELSGPVNVTVAPKAKLELYASSISHPDGNFTFEDILIESNGSLILVPSIIPNTNYSDDIPFTLHAANINVQTNGLISSNGRGYANSSGPGEGYDGTGAYNQGSGGGHGGLGGTGAGVPSVGQMNDDLLSPDLLGSGGGNTAGTPGGAGGGAVIFNVSGSMVNNGVISANGANGVSAEFDGSGGGSGGSLLITANDLSGTGSFQVKGGNGGISSYYGSGGGGAGGRIAFQIPASSNSFTGVYAAFGGTGNQIGGAGTIYFAAENKLLINNNTQNGNITPLPAADYDFTTLELKGTAKVRILGTNSTLSLTNSTIMGDNSARLESEGVVNAPAEFIVGNITLAILNDLLGPDDVTISPNAKLELYASSISHPDGVFEFEDVFIESSGSLILVPSTKDISTYADDIPLTLKAANINLQSSGLISTNGRGYGSTSGPGEGQDGTGANHQAGGAGHGGIGGKGTGGALGGTSYGDVYTPITLGSGGGATGASAGGSGGGAVRLVATGTIILNGIISANGNAGVSGKFDGGGGGSGGSILISSPSISGSGSIQANGGNGGSSWYYGSGGGGGGGRISISSTLLSKTITISAKNGTGAESGGIGTIYLDGVDPVLSTISISPSSPVVSDTETSTITVTLLDDNGLPIADQPVKLCLKSGGSLSLNYQTVAVNSCSLIGYSNAEGAVKAYVSSTKTGTYTFSAESGYVSLIQTASVVFIPGPVSSDLSSITVDKTLLPPDGSSAATVTVTALDAFNNTIAGGKIDFSTTGSAVLVPGSTTLDSSGKAVTKVTDQLMEKVTISAKIAGVPLTKKVTILFGLVDLAVTASGSQKSITGSDLEYVVNVANQGNATASNVVLSLTLPDKLTYSSDTSGMNPTLTGNVLKWNLGTLASGNNVSFTVTMKIASGASTGEILSSSFAATTATLEDNKANNTVEMSTTIVDPYTFTTTISQPTAPISIGTASTYDIKISNTGINPDTYTISVEGIDSSWVSLSESSAALLPGANSTIKATVNVNSCQAQGTYPFTATIISQRSGKIQTVSSSLTLTTTPSISIEAPSNNAVSGSTSVLFSWRTDTQTVGTLTLYPAGHPEEAQPYTTSSGTTHQVQVNNLTRNQSYNWFLKADSSCGSNTSSTRTLKISNGIIFTNHNPEVTIARDYDQLTNIRVSNTDSITHTLTASVINPYTDLIINFVDSGSSDETLTLQAGESRDLTLAIHAQDVVEHNYQITAVLTSVSEDIPITDSALIDISILWDGDFTITEDEAAFDPITLGKTYVITNNGSVITDFTLNAIDPSTGLPANVFIQPMVDHARLENGKTIRVVVYPIFSSKDVETTASTNAAHVAKPQESSTSDFQLFASGGGETKTLSGSTSCPAGSQIYPVVLESCTMDVTKEDWYCTNRPIIESQISLPWFLNSDTLDSFSLNMAFTPKSNVLSHSGRYYFNGTQIASFTDTIPSGQYSFPVQISTLNTAVAGSAIQNIRLETDHLNGAHYVSGANTTASMNVNQAITYACGTSAAAAKEAVQNTYKCTPTRSFNPETDVADISVNNIGESKTISGKTESDCPVAASCDTQEAVGDPINSRTGVFSLTTSDLSFSFAGGDLIFQRSYSTGWLNHTPSVFGYGWFSNHDAKLIFPTDEGGMAGFVLYKSVTGNEFLFFVEDDGSYRAGPGVLAALEKRPTIPVTYRLTLPDQNVFLFDEHGKIISRADEEGNEIGYSYDAQSGLLTRVYANGGARYINLVYNAGNQVSGITDHTGRTVSYGYDAAGNLKSVTDVLGHTWTYEYDAAHRIVKYFDPLGVAQITNEYDMQGRAHKQYDADGNLVMRIVFNADGSSTVYDALGKAQTFKFDSRNTTTVEKDPVGATIEKAYDANLRPSIIKTANGATTALSWSADGINLNQTVDATGNVTALEYDVLNNVIAVTDPLQNQTTFTYESTHLTSTTNAKGESTHYSYTTEGYLSSVTDSLGARVTYTYDDYGQLISMTEPDGGVWSYTYDDLGRLVSTTDPLGRVTVTEYNPAGWITKTINHFDASRIQNEENIYNITTLYQYDERGNQISVTDTYGNVTHYEYDANDNLVMSIDKLGNVTSYAYDLNGNLKQIIDPKGNKTRYTYNAVNQLLTVIDAKGNITSNSYNKDGTLAKTTDALGRVTSYTYDHLQRVIATTDAMGVVTTSDYDANGNLISTTTNDSVTTFEYDALGRMVRQIDAKGGITRSVYDEVGNLIELIDPKGNSTTYTYDKLGRMTGETDALGNITRYRYDAVGNRIAIEDPLGRITSFTYTTAGYQSSAIDALGSASTYENDALGQILSSTDQLGRTTNYEYDAMGRLLKQTDNLGGESRYTYDRNGNLISSTDANGHTTSMAYDGLNRMISQTDPNGLTTTFAYDSVGNLVQQTDSAGNSTSYAYDNLNRRIRVTDPTGNSTSFAYDAYGNLIRQVNGNGIATQYEYDKLGNLTAVIENKTASSTVDSQTNVRTEYSYDANGNLISIIDANGNTSAVYTYDELNRVLSETNALGVAITNTYDVAGNLTQVVDGNGNTILFYYDALNQLTSIDYPGSSDDVSFVYDAAGQRTKMEDASGTTNWIFDGLGRTASITDTFQKTVSYSYDNIGNRTGLTYPDGKQVSYLYDAGNRLTTVTDWQSLVTRYTYNSANLVSDVLLPNSVNTSYTYDASGRVLSIEHVKADHDYGSYTYTYDAVGNRTQVVEKYLTGLEAIPTVSVMVKDTQQTPQAGISVYAYKGSTFTGFSAITDAEGSAKFILPEGNYRFRADKNGLQYFSSPENDCTVLGCYSSTITIPVFTDVVISVKDSSGTAQPGLPVYTFKGTTNAGFTGITDEQGLVTLALPEGSYRFRADKNNEQFFSSVNDACTPPDCTEVSITIPQFASVTIHVTDSTGLVKADIPVYAFNESTYTGYHAVTDAEGNAVLLMREGEYRFRADVNGLQYFSAESNHCTVVGCENASIVVPVFGQVTTSVTNTAGASQEGLPVYVFSGTTYTNFSGITNSAGMVAFTLPEGDYRFATDLNGERFNSSNENQCTVPACSSVSVTVPQYQTVTISVSDSSGIPQSGLPVYAFDGTLYTGYNSTTGENGQAVLTLKEGNYRFRTNIHGLQYFSGETNHCTVMGCTSANITVPVFGEVVVSVTDSIGSPLAGLSVYAYDGAVYKGFSSTTAAAGLAVFTLPEGNYRFRADRDGEQVYSGSVNHCEVPGCVNVVIAFAAAGTTATPTSTPTESQTPTATTTPEPAFTPTPETPASYLRNPAKILAALVKNSHQKSRNLQQTATTSVIVTVTDTTGAVLPGLPVYVFDGTTYKNINAVTDANGQVTFNLAAGSYRFRADRYNQKYYSGTGNTCTTPDCSADSITVPVYGQVGVTVANSAGEVQTGLNVYAFQSTTYTGYSAVSGSDGVAWFNLPEGSYRFRADTHGLQYFSSSGNDCAVPSCSAVNVTVPVFGTVSVSVVNTAGIAQVNLPVYVFNGTSYTGFSARTDASGSASLTLPEGNYRFRTDLNGSQYFSSTVNHCSVPLCTDAAITTPVYGLVTVSVVNSEQAALAGLPVYVFNGTTYTGRSATTNSSGQVTFNLPEDSYRFRSDYNGQQYFSAAANHCTVPECTAAQVTAAVFGAVTVSVTDSTGAAQPDLPVYVYKSSTYTGFSGNTDANGQVTLSLPEGSYRFRADLYGKQYFNASTNTCTVPACTNAAITTPYYAEVTITTQSGAGKPQTGLTVYVYDNAAYIGLSGVTGDDGKVSLWIPEGSYRFRADQFDLQFFSSDENHCAVPGCTSAAVNTLGMQQTELTRTIEYAYDPLNRLTGAVYSADYSYAYTYDAVGNRLTETAPDGVNRYVYDAANRLSSVNDQLYTWDNNGNLLSDGAKTYTYDTANRLTAVTADAHAYGYVYNGLGDRVQSILDGAITTYTLDLNAGLTQVLADGTNTYTYGYTRLAQISSTQTGYFLGDALGSVRQVVDPQANVLLVKDYSPYGELFSSTGKYQTDFDYTGEMVDGSGLVFLRARYYDPATGRFFARDPFAGFLIQPASQHGYSYALNNPILYTDPSGKIVPLVAAAAIGAVVGGGIDIVTQLIQNDWNLKCVRWGEVLISAGSGAVAGFVGFIGFGAITSVFGTGFLAQVAAGSVSGVLAGQYSRITTLALSGNMANAQNVLMRPEDMLFDAAFGGLGGAVSYGLQRGLAGILNRTMPRVARTSSEVTSASIESAKNEVSEMARRAAMEVGEGSGSAYGIKVHTALRNIIRSLEKKDFLSEVSYQGGRSVKYGVKGSVRLDVLYQSNGIPTAIFDIKTGNSILAQPQINRIRMNLPVSWQDIPILEIHLP